MKLKLDLHPIYNDSRSIESSLSAIIDEAIERRATEIEIIPGKGSGALKKSVIRFLDRPEVKARYHRIEKDSDNWGRLFVHFRHEVAGAPTKARPTLSVPTENVNCACCDEVIQAPVPAETDNETSVLLDCPWCGSPNRVFFRHDRRGKIHVTGELAYEG